MFAGTAGTQDETRVWFDGNQFVLRVRVDHAAERLRSSGHSLAAIATTCGFYDQADFTRKFARLTNTTPRILQIHLSEKQLKRHVAFLRAINTGSRRAKNAQLSEVVEQVGASFAQGFIASGNVVFDVPEDPDASFGERLEAAYLSSLGFEVPVILRSAQQVRTIATSHPFTASELATSQGNIYVGLIQHSPSSSQVDAIMAMGTDRDRVVVHGDDLFWLPEAGEYLSGLSIPAVEGIARVLTVRSMSTIARLVAKFLSG